MEFLIVPLDSALQDESNRYLKLILSLSPPYKNPIFLACPYVGRG
jgi:hypothetical protein